MSKNYIYTIYQFINSDTPDLHISFPEYKLSEYITYAVDRVRLGGGRTSISKVICDRSESERVESWTVDDWKKYSEFSFDVHEDTEFYRFLVELDDIKRREKIDLISKFIQGFN